MIKHILSIIYLLYSFVFTSTSLLENEEDFLDLNSTEEETYFRDPSLRWNDYLVYYVVDTSINATDKEKIRSAMFEIERWTCIRFIEMPQDNPITCLPKDHVYINVTSSGYCEASQGRRGGRQYILLNQNCMEKGELLYLLLRTMGLGHEHQRPDRDDYIIIDCKNITEGYMEDYKKTALAKTDDLFLDYNFKSVMHFTELQGAIDASSPVMRSKFCRVKPYVLGYGRKHGILTKLDIHTIRKFYSCPY